MKSIILRDEIIFKIKDYLTAIQDYEDYKFKEAMEGRNYDPFYEDSNELEQNKLKAEISDLLLLLYKNSREDNFYFFDCPFKIYESHFHKRLFAYSHKYIDSNIFEFLKEELQVFNNPADNRILSNELLEVNYNKFCSFLKEFDFSIKKKTKFLINEIESMNYEVIKLPDEEIQVGLDQYEIQSGGYSINFKRNVKNINEFDSNKNNNFKYEESKSYEFNLSKLTIFPTISNERGLLNKISLDYQYNQQLIIDISELKAILIDSFFNQIKEVDSAYKVLLAERLCNNLKPKIEALQNQISLVKKHLTKADDCVLDLLTLSLSFNEEMYSTFEKVISIETPQNKNNVVSNQEILTVKKSENETFKNLYLKEFCKVLANDNLIQHNSFIHIFNLGILHLAPYLQDEIRENLLTLDPIKQNLYVDYLKNHIKSSPFYETSENTIKHYLSQYNADIKDFPEFNKGELYRQLNRFAYWQLLDEKEHLFLVDLQYDFFYYGSMLEAKKMIDFIDSLLTKKSNVTIDDTSTVSEINQEVVHPIFLNTDSYQLFLNLIEQLNILTSNISKKGNQAKFHAIWEVTDCKKKLFKPLTALEDYTSYLNNTYKTNYNSRSFSDGSKYHVAIRKIVNN